jgi:adenylate kinase family enzyme
MRLKKSYIFLLGRPGCGKSAVYNKLVKYLKEEKLADDFPRVDDFPKLWKLFQEDVEQKRSRRTEDGGYKVTDDTVWDDLLKELNNDIKNMTKEGRVIFVEFSRDSYKRAFKNFDKDVLEKAMGIYIDVPFEICWQRNVERHKKALAEGTDDHLVSKEEMEKTYKYDDGIEFAKTAPFPVEVIDNSKEGEEFLNEQIKNIIKILKEKYTE